MKPAASRRIIFVLVALLLLAGCGAKEPDSLPENQLLAVAPFEQPRQNWELLAGYPASGDELAPELMQELDQLLAAKLQEAGREDYLGPAQVFKCKKQVTRAEKRNRLSALRFWSQVGQCLQADYLLLPHVLQWRERKGGEWGVQEPARVHIELFLLDVKEQSLRRRFKFDQEQKALSQDLLQIRRFFGRGGKWISAQELAGEGMEQALQEWGL